MFVFFSTAGAMNRIEFIQEYKLADPDATREEVGAAWLEYREAEEKQLAREAEEKRLAREAEEKRLAREAEEKRLAREAEEKRLAREAEEKRLAREAEEKRLALELAIEQEKTKQGLGWSSLFLSRHTVSFTYCPSFDPSVPLICLCDVCVRSSSLPLLRLFVLSLSLSAHFTLHFSLTGVSGGGCGATTGANGTASACLSAVTSLEFSPYEMVFLLALARSKNSSFQSVNLVVCRSAPRCQDWPARTW
jgi:hypothetical protein